MLFIKMNELKLTQDEFFHFKSLAANASEFICVALYQIMNAFYTILTFHFNLKIVYAMHVNSPTVADENQLKCEKVRFTHFREKRAVDENEPFINSDFHQLRLAGLHAYKI